MARKKKEIVEILKINKENLVEETEKPKCFGNKCEYCRKSLCGEKWFDLCKIKSSIA